jgi:hypothetical protein
MINIYILKLQNEKYFIGKIKNNKIFKFKNFKYYLYDFTIQNQPLALYKFIENQDVFDLDKYVKKYMYKYGIDNVRGGSYLDIELFDVQKKLLQSEFWTIENKCHLCGENHLHKICNFKNITNIKETNYIYINKHKCKTPVIINNYVYYYGCSICGKNAVGQVNYTRFNYIITSPSYLDNNSNIKKLACCEICSTNLIGQQLLDIDNKLYLVRGLEEGQELY